MLLSLHISLAAELHLITKNKIHRWIIRYAVRIQIVYILHYLYFKYIIMYIS